MKTILLFGSSGFIGGAIAEHLQKQKGIQLLTPKRDACNLLKYSEVKKYMQSVEPDYVINAAYIEVNSNVKPTKKYLFDNLKISSYILKACKSKKSIKRILFFGSGLEYGDSKKTISESHSFNPKNYYAKTKAIQSEQTVELAKQMELPLILLKPFNLYGPHDNKSVLYYVIKSSLQNKDFSVTKGEQVRDILYIEDFLSLIDTCLRDDLKVNNVEVINAGYGKGVLLKDAINEILWQTKYEKEYGIRPYRDNEYFNQVADIGKAKRLTGWEPKVNLQEGIKKTIQWVKRIDV